MLAASRSLAEGSRTGVEPRLNLSAEDLWTDVSTRLREALNDSTYSTWFAEADGAELNDGAFVLAVPNDFTRGWIEGHFLGLLEAAVRDTLGEERSIRLV